MAKTKKKPTTKPKFLYFSNYSNTYFLFIASTFKLSVWTEKKDIFSITISAGKPTVPYTFEKITRISRTTFEREIEKKKMPFTQYVEIFNKAIGH